MSYIALTTIITLFSFPQIPSLDLLVQDEPVIEEVSVPDILQKIAFCESRTGHFDDDGNIVVGKKNKYDIGKYQINILYWEEFADKLGHDLYTEEGNEAMALVLYERYGTKPWNSSKKCWGKHVTT